MSIQQVILPILCPIGVAKGLAPNNDATVSIIDGSISVVRSQIVRFQMSDRIGKQCM